MGDERDFSSKDYVIRNPRVAVGMVRVREDGGTNTYYVPGKGGTLRVSGEVLESSEGLIVKEACV